MNDDTPAQIILVRPRISRAIITTVIAVFVSQILMVAFFGMTVKAGFLLFLFQATPLALVHYLYNKHLEEKEEEVRQAALLTGAKVVDPDKPR